MTNPSPRDVIAARKQRRLSVPKSEPCECCGRKTVAIGAVTTMHKLKRRLLGVTVEIRQMRPASNKIPALCMPCFVNYVIKSAERLQQ
jgi:hypothetical protein